MKKIRFIALGHAPRCANKTKLYRKPRSFIFHSNLMGCERIGPGTISLALHDHSYTMSLSKLLQLLVHIVSLKTKVFQLVGFTSCSGKEQGLLIDTGVMTQMSHTHLNWSIQGHINIMR